MHHSLPHQSSISQANLYGGDNYGAGASVSRQTCPSSSFSAAVSPSQGRMRGLPPQSMVRSLATEQRRLPSLFDSYAYSPSTFNTVSSYPHAGRAGWYSVPSMSPDDQGTASSRDTTPTQDVYPSEQNHPSDTSRRSAIFDRDSYRLHPASTAYERLPSPMDTDRSAIITGQSANPSRSAEIVLAVQIPGKTRNAILSSFSNELKYSRFFFHHGKAEETSSSLTVSYNCQENPYSSHHNSRSTSSARTFVWEYTVTINDDYGGVCELTKAQDTMYHAVQDQKGSVGAQLDAVSTIYFHRGEQSVTVYQDTTKDEIKANLVIPSGLVEPGRESTTTMLSRTLTLKCVDPA